MSLFLLQEPIWGGLHATRPSGSSRQSQRETLLRVERSLQEQMRKHKAFTDISMADMSKNTRYFMLFEGNGYSTRGVASFNCNKNSGEISLKIDVLTPQNTFLKFDNRHQAIKMCRNLYDNSAYDRLFSKIAVDMNTKLLKVHIPYLTHSFSNPFEFTYEAARENAVVISYKAFIETYLPYLEKLLQDLLPLQRRKDLNSGDKNQLSNIHKYSEMVVVATHLSQDPIQAEQQFVERYNAQEKSIMNLCKGRQAVPAGLIKNSQLMCLIPEQSHQLRPTNEYRLTGEELKKAQEKTRMAMQPRLNHPDNTMLLNNIIIFNPTEIRLQKINEGGFSSIWMAGLSFWYSEVPERDPSFNRKQVMEPRKMINRFCVIKEEKREKKSRSRNQHEINIIKILKNQSSAYLFKYYLPLNEPNHFPNRVILDYTPYNNLGEYMINNKETLSLKSKLYLMFHVVQSLRNLRDFKIVHLDIKPTNIMVHSYNMMTKLIDFGESYHPDLCNKNYKPGYTPTYSSPQIFQQGYRFTDKSDVFSLGVVFYQMLYGRLPFDFDRKDRAQMQTEMKSYLKLWYFSPEQFENYGDNTVLRLLNNVLSKCLSADPEQRPQLDMLALIVRLSFELVL